MKQSKNMMSYFFLRILIIPYQSHTLLLYQRMQRMMIMVPFYYTNRNSSNKNPCLVNEKTTTTTACTQPWRIHTIKYPSKMTPPLHLHSRLFVPSTHAPHNIKLLALLIPSIALQFGTNNQY